MLMSGAGHQVVIESESEDNGHRKTGKSKIVESTRE